eukprot:gene4462-5055_t
MAANNRKSFRWSDEMLENLLKCIMDFKTQMNYRGLDFDGDKPRLYSEIRTRMAAIYEADNVDLFGAVESKTWRQPEDPELMSDAEIKEVVEEPVAPTSSVTKSTVIDDTTVQDVNSKKRTSAVPTLVDNKRKHLERSLSAAQRDKILLDEAKEDALFRREMSEAMKDSTKSFSESASRLSSSVEVMAHSISNSIERLAQAMCQPAINQNMFYQNAAPPRQQQFYQNMLNDFDAERQSSSTRSNFNQGQNYMGPAPPK